MARPGTNPSDPVSGTGTTQGTTQTPGTTQTQSGAGAAHGEGEHLTDRARRKAGEVMQQVEDSAEDMRERARSAVDHQKDAAVGRIEGVAHALRSASDDLRERGQPMVAESSRQVAEGLESMAHSLSRRNVDELVGSVEDFARQRPVAFIGGAMVAGFALARFMKSSSARRSRTTGTEYRGAAGSYGEGMSARTEHGGASTATPGSYGQDMPRRTEYGGDSTHSAGSSGQGRQTPAGPSTQPPASGGTPGGGYGRSTEGGI